MERRNQVAFVNEGLLRTEDGRYSNLALILSDQCPWTIEMRSEGSVISVVRGSVLAQLHGIEKRVIQARSSRLKEGECQHKVHYLALSEIILNALSHRSYCSDEPTVIGIGVDSMTVVSPGGLMRTGNGHDGRSRNPRLTDILRTLGFNNAMVKGMQGVVQCYRNS